MCILCTFIENWEHQYDQVKYPLAFYNYFLKRIKACQQPNNLFTCLFLMLHWKYGKVREGTDKAKNMITINGKSFSWSNINIDFEKYRNDANFLNQCFDFRDGVIDGHEFFEYLREKKIFGKSLVLQVFLLHLLRPSQYPMIDQHVWRAMRVFHANLKSIYEKPKTWSDYKQYMEFFNNVVKSLKGEGHIQFDKQTIDRALMSFGKWIKSKKKKGILPETFNRIQPKRGAYAGKCPKCGSPLKWRKARRTGELYRGCTNYPQCRWQDRSY